MNTASPKKLWNKNFLLFVAGMELGYIANALLNFAIPLYVLLETGNPALMGTVLTISAIPGIAFLPVGGIVADRFPKRKVLALMNFTIAIAIVAYLGISNILAVVPATIIFMLLFSALGSLMLPSSEASVPVLVPTNDLVKANSATWLMTIFSSVGSPVLGGFILARFGLTPVLYLSIALYVLASIVKLMVKIPYAKQPATRSLSKIVAGDIKDGLRFITKENIEIGKVILTSLFVGLFFMPLSSIALPVLLSTYLEMGEATVGIVQGVVVIGGVVGVMLLGALGKKANVAKIRPFLLICCAMLLLGGVGIMLSANATITLVITIASFFIAFAFLTMYAIIASAYFGEKAPEHLVGKVISLDFAAVGLGAAAGNQILGLLLNRFIHNPGIVLLIAAVPATLCLLCIKIKGDQNNAT